MANQADGTVLIDTEIKKDGAIEDVNTLKEALQQLTAAVKDLTAGLANSFGGIGKQAESAADQIDKISDSAKQAETSVESLEKQMAKITVDNGLSPDRSDTPEPRYGHARGEFIDYGNTVQEFVNKYATGMDTVSKKNTEVKQSTTQATTAIKSDFQGAEQSPNMLLNAITLVKNAVFDIPQIARMAGIGISNAFSNSGSQVMDVGQKVDALKGKIDALEKQGLYFGDKEYDQAYASLKRAELELEQYKKRLSGVDTEQKKATRSNKGFNKGLKETRKNANSTKLSIMGMLGRSLLFSVVFRALSGVSNSIKEGTQNIARYSDSTNKALSRLMSSLTMLKNSFAAAFAPVIEYVTPALTRLVSMLVDVNNWIAQTMAALAGKNSFVKAVAVQEDYAASLDDTKKAAKEAAKEVKKASYAFDTLIQLQKPADTDKYKGPTPDQMFKTEQVSTEAKALADDIKKTLSNLFQPIKDSWVQYGPSTIEAVKTMFGSLKQLAGDVGASFMQVWKDEGYGKAVSDDLLITFNNLALTVANLADQFDKAWVEADTGTNIMRHLGDIVLIVTGFFREASESIKNWASKLDFGPLLIAFDKVLVSLMPIVSKVGDGLLWLLNNVLLPLAKWALEKALPVALELVAAGLDVLNSTIDALKPLALWLWEEFIKPIGQWTGAVIIGAIKKLTEKLKEFSDWINNNQEKVRYITGLIGAFFLAWKVTEFVTKIKLMMNFLSETGLMGVLTRLMSKLDLTSIGFFGTAAAVGALVLAAYEIYKNWNKMTPTEKVIAGVLAAASAFAILAVSMGAVAGPAGAALRAVAIAAAIGAALVAINAGARSATSSVSNGFGGGSRSFSVASYSNAPYAAYANNVPMLATGTVVPPKAGNFLAMLGDNNKDYEVVSPLGTIKQAVLEAIGEAGGLGGGTVQADLIVDGTKFGQLVYKYNNNETQRVGVRMVTNGG
ncbi:hypothetical protein [Clostridium sp. HBUAS56010]|uniref:hypothetical protein n=1 Tax=Clostridium sp. HBUAS56010 TaxID=2571127 RepID=UPI001177BF1C|nr:hypothetical protein [Clostridium sp. HBUAS56010]